MTLTLILIDALDWVRTLASGATVSPRLEAGLRHDGGDAETGLGLEVGGGVDWSDPGLGLSAGLEGRTLALHEDGDFEDWGLAFTFSYDLRPDTKRGFSLGMKQDLGRASSGGVGALPAPEAFPDAGNAGRGDWTTEMAFGTGRGRGMVGSRYAALGGGRPGRVEDVRLGYRIEPDADHAPDASVSVWGGAEDAEAAAGAALEWRW